MINREISLRALEPEDLELLYDWENDMSNWLISNTMSPFSRFTLKRYLENSHKDIYETGQLRLMIDYTAENKTIGTIDLFDFDPFHRRAGLGILIAAGEYRRRGFATMALEYFPYFFTILVPTIASITLCFTSFTAVYFQIISKAWHYSENSGSKKRGSGVTGSE